MDCPTRIDEMWKLQEELCEKEDAVEKEMKEYKEKVQVKLDAYWCWNVKVKGDWYWRLFDKREEAEKLRDLLREAGCDARIVKQTGIYNNYYCVNYNQPTPETVREIIKHVADNKERKKKEKNKKRKRDPDDDSVDSSESSDSSF